MCFYRWGCVLQISLWLPQAERCWIWKPLTDSTICSPHTECNHTDLQSASDCHSLSFRHEEVSQKTSKAVRTENTELSAHTGTNSVILSDFYHTQSRLNTNTPMLTHLTSGTVWTVGTNLPTGWNIHSQNSVCDSDWSKNLCFIENCVKNETCTDHSLNNLGSII